MAKLILILLLAASTAQAALRPVWSDNASLYTVTNSAAITNEITPLNVSTIAVNQLTVSGYGATNIVNAIGTPGSSNALPTEAGVRAAITASETNTALLNAANVFTGGRQTIKCGPGASVSPNSLADDFFIDCDELNTGMTIAPTNGGNANIFFATQSRGNKAAFWQYFSGSDLVRQGVGNIDRFEMRQTLSRHAVPVQILSNIKVAPVKILAEFSSDGAAAPNGVFVMKNGTGTNYISFSTNQCLYGTKINMNGNSIINIGTNSLYFEDGTRLSVSDKRLCINDGFRIGTNAITHKNVTNSVIEVEPGTNGSYFAKLDIDTRIKKLEVESEGFTSKGRGRFRGADLELSDPFRGVIRVTTNAGSEVMWGEVVTDNGDDTASLDLIRLTYSPEMPFSNRVAAIKSKQQQKRELRGQIQAGLKANPNSVPALRAIVWKMAEYLNIDLEDD